MTKDGIGYVAKVTSSGSVSYPVQNQGGVITCCHAWDGKLFYGYGYNKAQIGMYDGATHTIEKTFSGMGGFGDLCEFDSKLFASVFTQGGGMELWCRDTSATWSCVGDSSVFSAFGTPGVSGGLKGWVGAMTVIDDKLYMVTNDTEAGRTGPSYLFSIEYKGTGASFDLASVTWLDTNVSGWAQTSVLSSVTISGSNISFPFDKTNVWASYYLSGDNVYVNANPWIFIPQDGTWYAATFEWFRPGTYTKPTYVVDGDHIKQFSVIPEDWSPTSGVEYGFMVSSIARGGASSGVQERTNIVMFTWP